MTDTRVHIRHPARRRGGSQFYRDRASTYNSTVCGSEPTAYDIEAKWASNHALINGRQICEDCRQRSTQAPTK